MARDAGMAEDKIAAMTCISYYASNWESGIVNKVSTAKDYGLWQISSEYWCFDPAAPGKDNGCRTNCDAVLDPLTNAVCASLILQQHGLSYWFEYKAHLTTCQNYVITDCGGPSATPEPTEPAAPSPGAHDSTGTGNNSTTTGGGGGGGGTTTTGGGGNPTTGGGGNPTTGGGNHTTGGGGTPTTGGGTSTQGHNSTTTTGGNHNSTMTGNGLFSFWTRLGGKVATKLDMAGRRLMRASFSSSLEAAKAKAQQQQEEKKVNDGNGQELNH